MMDFSPAQAQYINIDDALARIGGNMMLYKRLLGRFLEGNQFNELENALNSGDKEEALRQAHSLKGVSANLSLIKIHSCSVQLEQSLKDNTDYASYLGELSEALKETTEIISEIIAD